LKRKRDRDRERRDGGERRGRIKKMDADVGKDKRDNRQNGNRREHK